MRKIALTTIVVLLLAYAAFDDITTDNDTDFRLEYGMLILAALWMAYVAVWAVLRRRPSRTTEV